MLQYLHLIDSEQNTNFFNELYETYKDEMFYVAYEILHNQQDVEDVIHETFVILLDSLDEMKKNPPQKNWNYILTIVKNKSYNLLKQRKYHSDREFVIEMLEDVMDEELDKKIIRLEEEEVIKDALKRMNKTYRDILILQYYHEMSITEIARIFGKTPDNIRHLSLRAKKKLKKLLMESEALNIYGRRKQKGKKKEKKQEKKQEKRRKAI